HAVEPLLMLPKRIVRPRELVENLGVPADRVRIVDWMPRLVETSRLPSVPERLRKVRLSVIMDLRHREMRHIRIRIFFEQRLRRFACVDVSTRKDKRIKRKFLRRSRKSESEAPSLIIARKRRPRTHREPE